MFDIIAKKKAKEFVYGKNEWSLSHFAQEF